MNHFVVATAGHVDHGKSTLVRALTGIETDRWAEERRRGLTIDLGYAWTTLPSGDEVAFVDVPGHERFIPNTLAGLGPASIVCFVVAADEGWSRQSSEHRDAVAALGIQHGVVVTTKADREAAELEAVAEQARRELSTTGLSRAPIVTVSATTGQGLDEFVAALEGVLAKVPAASDEGPIRLWIDRSFTIHGAGTVVTGTLTSGTLSVGDQLRIGDRSVTIRGLQREGVEVERVRPTSRVAVNLRGVAAQEVRRGDALVTPAAWPLTDLIDVSGHTFTDAAEQLIVHVGTAAVGARVRPLDDGHARLTLARPLPLLRGEPMVLRDPGSHRIIGATLLDEDPPALHRRGDAKRRAAALARGLDAHSEVLRRGAMRESALARIHLITDQPPAGIIATAGWWIGQEALQDWAKTLSRAVHEHLDVDPLSAGLSYGAAVDLLQLPDLSLLDVVIAAAQVIGDGRHLRSTDPVTDALPAALTELESRLAEHPFAAPTADELAELGLGTKELAAAERVGRLTRLSDGIVVLPDALALARTELAQLPQPFTTSAARVALNSTRRITIPLLEHLDRLGWTRRIGDQRIVVADQVPQ